MSTQASTVAIFAGARAGKRPAYAAAAHALGRGLAEREIDILYGGTALGLMEHVAHGCLAAGGRIQGVFPDVLLPYNIVEQRVDCRVVATFAERKAVFMQADAVIALPGGFGTLDEVFEMLVLTQFGVRKPVVLWNIDGFFDGIVTWCDHAVAEELLSPHDRALLSVASTVDAVFTLLPAAHPAAGAVSQR